jgi:hypothetical protein
MLSLRNEKYQNERYSKSSFTPLTMILKEQFDSSYISLPSDTHAA